MPETPSISNASNTYDDVPYESHPFAQTHPSRLFTVATLFGLRPAPVQKCRVLELGCAAGGNLLPIAEAFPETELVGLDLSARQIADGNELVKSHGAKNITLKHASILDVDESYGKFDYLICHGVFSWVPPNVQDKILDICAKNLNPQGIAYISYNTYPGWHMRGMIRDMMKYHAARFTTPQLKTQQARALLDFLAKSVKQDNSAYSTLLKSELETLRHQADHYLYHEHLEENNEPLYFHHFAERAKAKGMKYLGEARVGTMVTGNFGPEIENTLKMIATDQIQAEQYMDFLRNRMFRETLLCHNSVNPNWAVTPDALRPLHVASGAAPTSETVNTATEENVSYKGASGMTMATNRPLLKSAMQVLKAAFPGTVPFDSLRKQARELAGGNPADPKVIAEDTQTLAVGLLNCYMQSDLIELHGGPVTFGRTVGDKPTALPLARLQATKGAVAANRRHEVIRLNELDRHLLPLLDGTHDKPAIVEKLVEVAKAGKMHVQKDGTTLYEEADIRVALQAVIEQAVANVARIGLLVP
ncbi:MAG: methyltransferase regulatory domain-containing protein [Fimbriiglobus sp.]